MKNVFVSVFLLIAVTACASTSNTSDKNTTAKSQANDKKCRAVSTGSHMKRKHC